MLIWCFKQVKDFILMFLKNETLHKIIKFAMILFFTSAKGFDEVLVSLQLIEKIIKDASSMYI